MNRVIDGVDGRILPIDREFRIMCIYCRLSGTSELRVYTVITVNNLMNDVGSPILCGTSEQ